MYAGGTSSTNYGYYLYTGNIYWTMSPFHFNATYSYAIVFRVNSDGALDHNSVDWTAPGVRPVISLTTNNTITGSGTISDPYVVVQ